MEKNDQPKFRSDQIKKAIFRDGISSFSEITTIPLDFRKKIEEEIKMLSFDIEKILVAKNRQSAKALLKLNDGNFIETVLISPMPKLWSVCISCQVGCPMSCGFCATGKMGFKRNLTAEEISDQVLFWRQYLKRQETIKKQQGINKSSFRMSLVNNVVYMGMGEPFLNWKEVSESVRILTDKNIFGFGSRSISISTAGISEGIEKMAREFPQVNLAISLHFAEDDKRSRFMPINNKDNLSSIRKALQEYFKMAKRKVFLEYIMLGGINDSKKDAKMLADYINSTGNDRMLHVNLIRYNKNKTEGCFEPSSKGRTIIFKNYLLKNKISVTIRKSLGEEIQGACGQLSSTS